MNLVCLYKLEEQIEVCYLQLALLDGNGGSFSSQYKAILNLLQSLTGQEMKILSDLQMQYDLDEIKSQMNMERL